MQIAEKNGHDEHEHEDEPTSRKEPKIVVAEHYLTILLAKDNGFYCAKCPELDLVTELPIADAALEDLIEAIQDYAKEYLHDRDRYATSPNRAHHLVLHRSHRRM